MLSPYSQRSWSIDSCNPSTDHALRKLQRLLQRRRAVVSASCKSAQVGLDLSFRGMMGMAANDCDLLLRMVCSRSANHVAEDTAWQAKNGRPSGDARPSCRHTSLNGGTCVAMSTTS